MHFELHKRRAASIVFAAVAAGELLAIYVMYKVTNMWNTWTRDGPSEHNTTAQKLAGSTTIASTIGLEHWLCHED